MLPRRREAPTFTVWNWTPRTLTNKAYPTHIFYDGYVNNTLSENSDGVWSTSAQGAGTNKSIGIAKFNQIIGPPSFTLMHVAMLVFTTEDRWTGGAMVDIYNFVTGH
jgi:hypothetical protein